MTAFQLTELAEADLREILDHVERTSGPGRADGVCRDLLRAARELAAMPRMGHARKDLTARPVLFWPVHSWFIVYRPDTRPLQIVRMVSGWRDVAALLGDEDA